MASTRRLAAIVAADVAGYSRLMGVDEEGTLAALKAIRRELGSVSAHAQSVRRRCTAARRVGSSAEKLVRRAGHADS